MLLFFSKIPQCLEDNKILVVRDVELHIYNVDTNLSSIRIH